jgi:hypothetical protein
MDNGAMRQNLRLHQTISFSSLLDDFLLEIHMGVISVGMD